MSDILILYPYVSYCDKSHFQPKYISIKYKIKCVVNNTTGQSTTIKLRLHPDSFACKTHHLVNCTFLILKILITHEEYWEIQLYNRKQLRGCQPPHYRVMSVCQNLITYTYFVTLSCYTSYWNLILESHDSTNSKWVYRSVLLILMRRHFQINLHYFFYTTVSLALFWNSWL